MSPELEKRIAALAADRRSGASEILTQAIAILRDSLSVPADLPQAARALVRAQPSMAPVWNAALVALRARDRLDEFTTFAERVSRAPAALARFGTEAFGIEDPVRPVTIVTLSWSRSVVQVLTAMSRARQVRVSCSESRPALEGRVLATALSELGIGVVLCSDAAIGRELERADAVLVGADAVAPDAFVNKAGTRMLAADAMFRGVPVYVVASRDKFVSASVAERLVLRSGSPAEVWADAPPDVGVINPYFEWTPVELVTTFITDVGLLGAGAVGDVCHSAPQISAELTS